MDKLMEKDGIIALTSPSPLSPMMGGWGCGYVSLPQGHPWFGSTSPFAGDFDITYAHPDGTRWVIGFDTGHSWMNLKNTPMEVVEGLTRDLLNEAIKAVNEDNGEDNGLENTEYDLLKQMIAVIDKLEDNLDNNDDFDIALMRAKKSLKALIPYF